MRKNLETDHKERRVRAAVHACRGKEYDRKGMLSEAEGENLQALKILCELCDDARDQADAVAAGEICEYLADLCMQGGNMHGADRYYVLAMEYRKRG